MPKRFIKYISVGVLTALSELMIFTILVRIVTLHIITSNIIAVIIATSLNYGLNRSWSFTSRSPVTHSLVQYLILFGFNLVFSTYAIYYMVQLGLLDVIAKIMTMALITTWNFILYQKVIFRD